MLALMAVMAITIFQRIAYYQLANVLPVWIQEHVALEAGSFSFPVPWFQSIDPLFSILGVPLLFWIWRRQAPRGARTQRARQDRPGRLALRGEQPVAGGRDRRGGRQAGPPVWPFLYCAVQGIAFLYYWPTLLALVSRTAPAQVNATMMGLAFMSIFVGNILIGWIGGFYEKMTPLRVLGLHAAIGATGGVLVLLFGRATQRGCSIPVASRQPLRPSAMTHEVER